MSGSSTRVARWRGAPLRRAGQRAERLVLLALTLYLSLMASARESVAQLTPESRARGFRFEPPLLAFAESARGELIVGSSKGRTFQSEDFGESWLEGEVLVPLRPFWGATHRLPPIRFSPLYPLRGVMEPTAAALFSFKNSIALEQRLPQAGWLIRGYYQGSLSGGDLYEGWVPSQSRRRASGRLAAAVGRAKGWGFWVYRSTLLEEKAGNRPGVTYLTFHPEYERQILAGTQTGLYKSTDGGDSWINIFQGSGQRDRTVLHIAFDPRARDTIWLGTAQGLRISENGGATFSIPSSPFLISSQINWIHFSPHNPNEIYLGLSWALIKSTDGGESWGISFMNPSFPPMSYIRVIAQSPERPGLIFFGTNDGLFQSVDGGEHFERSGGLLFMGQQIRSIVPGAEPGTFLVATEQDLWVSRDSGESWQVLLFGGDQWRIQRLFPTRLSPGSFWLLTENELILLRPQGRRPFNDRERRALEELFAREPPLSPLLRAALEQSGVSIQVRRSLRARASWANLLPRIELGALYQEDLISFTFESIRFASGDEQLRAVIENDGTFDRWTYSAFAWWDLRRLIFDRGELPSGRGEQISRTLEERIRGLVVSLYGERRRLMIDEVLNEDERLSRRSLFRRLRLEELTAHLNQLTGDLLPPFVALKGL